MNKSGKIILGVCMIVVGVFLLVTYFTGNDLFSFVVTAKDYVKKEMGFAATDVKRIIIDNSNSPITIKTADTKYIEVTYFESKKQKYTVEENNGELKIVKNPTRVFFNFVLAADDYIEVLVPEDMAFDYDVKNSNGRITLDNLTTDKALIKTSNATIDSSDVSGKELNLTSSNGRINVNDSKVTTLTGKTSNSLVNLDNITSNNINVKTSNGRVSLININAAKNLTVVTSNSSLIFDGVTSPYIDGKTSNGKISGLINGDNAKYRKVLKTSNGSISVNDNEYGDVLNEITKNEKSLFLKTSNSSIDIDIKTNGR